MCSVQHQLIYPRMIHPCYLAKNKQYICDKQFLEHRSLGVCLLNIDLGRMGSTQDKLQTCFSFYITNFSLDTILLFK